MYYDDDDLMTLWFGRDNLSVCRRGSVSKERLVGDGMVN